MPSSSINDFTETPDNVHDESDIVETQDILEEYSNEDLGQEELDNDMEQDDLDVSNSVTFEDDSIQFYTHQEPVYAVGMHPSDVLLLISGGGDDQSSIWRLDTGDTVHKLPKHSDSVSAVGFSSDGIFAASGGMDGKVHVVYTATGQVAVTLEGPSEVVWINWHPKGNVLLAGSEDGTVWMWQIPSGQCMHVFTGHTESVTSGRFTPDGKSVVTISSDGSLIQWDPKTGLAITKLTNQYSRFHQDAITAFAIHKDNQMVFTGALDGSIRISHLGQGKILGIFANHAESIESVIFSNSDMHPYAISGSSDGVINIWDMNTFQKRASCKHEDSVIKLIWIKDSACFLSASTDKSVCKWDARTGECMKVWKGHQEGILDVEMSFCGEYFVTGSDDGVCLVFEN